MRLFSLLEGKILKVIIILILFLIFGVMGYMVIEGYSLLEAIYMTVITLSTVGYHEVNPLSQYGQMFTIVLILSGVGVLAYAASIFAEELIDGKFLQRYRNKAMEKKIKDYDQHVIICGFGRNGRQAARKLNLYDTPFLVIEKDQDHIQREHQGLENITFVEGDATSDVVLQKAQVEDAKALIAALPSDADNLYIVLSAKQLNPKLKIISRASDSSSMKKLKIAGADNVIMPDKIGGEHMASLIVTPDLVEFLDKINVESSTHVNMIEISMSEFPKAYVGKSIKELNIRELTGCTIIGLKNNAYTDFVVNPEYHTRLTADNQLIILGRPEQIIRFRKHFQL